MISEDELEYDLLSGQIYESSFTVSNNLDKDLDYIICYTELLGVDDYTIGLWDFNRADNYTLNDISNNGNDGQIYGPVPTDGKFGNAYKFDGWDDYVVIESTPIFGLSSFTIESWVKIDSVKGWCPIGPVKFWEYGLLYNEQGFLRAHVWSNGLKWFDVEAELDDSVWHYVVMTYDSVKGYLSVYLDGLLLESRFTGQGTIESTDNKLLIGRAWTENMWDFFNGTIDEVRLSNVVRTVEEIRVTYDKAVSFKGDWIKIINFTGLIESGADKTINFLLNTTKTEPGIYEKNLTLRSLTQDEEVIQISVTLNVMAQNHDIKLDSLHIDSEYLAGKPTKIEFNIKNQGTVLEKSVTSRLYINDRLASTTNIENIYPGESRVVRYFWEPDISGIYKITLYTENVEGETSISNNFLQTVVQIEGEPSIKLSVDKIFLNVTNLETTNFMLNIMNTGSADLNFYLFDTNSSIYFYDEMETDFFSWTHKGEFDPWERGTPRIGIEHSHSGLYCWGTSLENNYDDLTDAYLETPMIDLSEAVQPKLEFWNWYSIDEYGDKGYVEVWKAGKWYRLNGNGYSGYSDGWKKQTFDLREYLGSEIKIRFRLDTNEYIRDKGWFIDDVIVQDEYIKRFDYVTQSSNTGTLQPKESLNITLVIFNKINSNYYNDTLYIFTNDPQSNIIEIPIKLLLNQHYNSSTIEDRLFLNLDLGPDIIINEDKEYDFKIYNIDTNIDTLYYKWIINGTHVVTFNINNPNYIFNDPGEYIVYLYVYSDFNISASDIYKIIVKDVTIPSTDAGNNIQSYLGELIIFNGSKSTDNIGIINYIWDFGDNTQGNGKIAYHFYTNEGEYNVTLTCLDSEKNTGTDKIKVNVISTNIHNDEGTSFISINKILFILLLFISIIVIVLLVYFLYKHRR